MMRKHWDDALLMAAITRLDDDDLLDLYVEFKDEPEVTGHSFLEAEVGLRFNRDDDNKDDEDSAVYYECSCVDGKPVWTVVGGETDTIRSAESEA